MNKKDRTRDKNRFDEKIFKDEMLEALDRSNYRLYLTGIVSLVVLFMGVFLFFAAIITSIE